MQETTNHNRMQALLNSVQNVDSTIATNLGYLRSILEAGHATNDVLAIVDHTALLAKVVTVNAAQLNKLEARVSALEKQGNSPQPKLVAVKLEFMGMETNALTKELH